VASARANLSLTFNSNGDPVATDQLTPGTTVSAAMIPVVTAPTTADALTELGLPGALLDLLIPSGVEWPYHAAGTAPTGFVFPIGQACTPAYPDYRAKLIAAGSPYGTNGVDPLMPDRRSTVAAGKSNMGGVDNGLLPGGTVLGAVLGAADVVIAQANLPAVNLSPASLSASSVVTNGENVHRGAIVPFGAGAGGTNVVNVGGVTVSTITVATSISGAVPLGGSGTALNKVQPTFICNVILKVH
jgi:hypothetical protein